MSDNGLNAGGIVQPMTPIANIVRMSADGRVGQPGARRPRDSRRDAGAT